MDTLLSLASQGKPPRVNLQVHFLNPLRYLRETPAATRRLAILSSVGGVLVVGIGVYLTDIHHAGGVFVLVIGAAETLLSLALIPLARRRAQKGLPESLSNTNVPTWLSLFGVCLVGPGVSDALNHQFTISSAVFTALGILVYLAAFGISRHRRRLQRNDRSARNWRPPS